jgi:hypothetical protein
MGLCQAADFADRVASGVLTADVAAEVESPGAACRCYPGEVGCGKQKPQAGGESGCHVGREDEPPAPAGGGVEGGEPGHR